MEEKVLRVSQVDVLEFDDELLNVLQDRFMNIFRYIPSFTPFVMLKPELKSLVRLLIWKWSIYDNGMTFGQRMMGLKYSQHCSSMPTKLDTQPISLGKYNRWLFVSFILMEWLHERFENIVGLLNPRIRSENILDCITSIVQFANLMNFCIFLLKGTYPSLKERLLHLQMSPMKQQTLREPSYDFMNKEIIWYGFSEFLFFVLPYVNFFAMRNWFRTILYNTLNYKTTWSSTSGNLESCALCQTPPILPQLARCGHIYCYYCIAANVQADNKFPCTICNESVSSYVHSGEC